MVVPSLAIGGAVGVLLSAGFIWWEVGRYATPQVPVTVFDERKVLAAYTVGLFVGVPLAVAYVLFGASVVNGALPGAALFLGGLVGGTEVAQLFLVRSRYWGAGRAVPFYALSLRAGVGGILALTVLASDLGSSSLPPPVGIAAAAVAAVALVTLEVAGALVSLRPATAGGPRVGGPLAGAAFSAVAFFLLALGPVTGAVGSVAAPLVVLAGATFAYRGRRGTLAEVPPPTGPPLAPDRPLPYGRTSPSGPEPAPLPPDRT